MKYLLIGAFLFMASLSYSQNIDNRFESLENEHSDITAVYDWVKALDENSSYTTTVIIHPTIKQKILDKTVFQSEQGKKHLRAYLIEKNTDFRKDSETVLLSLN